MLDTNGNRLYSEAITFVRTVGTKLLDQLFSKKKKRDGKVVDIDLRGHERSCPDYDIRAPRADPNGTHIDLFCYCHRFTEPMILENGTDIAWPAGWSEKEAYRWRKKHRLERDYALDVGARQEDHMATNKPAGDGQRNGAMKARSQIETPVMGEERFTKRDDKNGEFTAQKKDGENLKA